MIDGTRCYQAMNELEQWRWQRAVICNDGGMNYMLNKKWHTFEEFIVNSFTWSETKEGYDYWMAVSERYVLHDTLSPQKKFINKPPEII